MYSHSRIIYLLVFFAFFLNINTFAQRGNKFNITAPQSADAEASLPDLLKGDNLSQFNADQISDAQISGLQTQLQSHGVTADQAGQMALAKGMPPAEWQKLKNRLSQSGGKPNAGTAGPTTISSAERTVAENDYKSYQKEPGSNVFGSSFFNSPSLSFEPNLRIATPANYVLGPDDELLISVSGYQETSLRITVQPEGTIAIPQVGSINVSGLTIEEATARIKDKMAHTAYFSLQTGRSTLIISLSKIKSIHITVIGASKPGNYTVSSLATVFNSLYLCGGPGDINTYRDIELIRNNKIYRKIDIYQFLTRGDQQGNVPLKENDVINFPVYKKRVTISGEVKRTGVFELRQGETFQDLLFFAGGFTNKAYQATIKVMQTTDTERKIKDISKADIPTYQPANGDEFVVDAILDRFENGVSINGAVYRPGQFELIPGLTLSALIKRAGGLQENVFTDRAILSRSYPDGTRENITFNVRDILNGTTPDIKLIKRDIVSIASATDFKSTYTITIQGEVRKPGQFPFEENLSLKDVLFRAGGFTDAATSYNIEIGRRIVSERRDRNVDTIATVFNINTERGLGIENNKFILKPYDIITIRRNPGYTEQQTVTINGEVNYPGSYTIRYKKEHVSDLIKRAGGLTSLAYDKGVFLLRNAPVTDTANQQKIRNIQNIIRDTSSKVIQDVSRVNNRIAVNMKSITDNPGSQDDYLLENGDVIEILKTDPLVKVSGEVLSSTQTGFKEGESLRYYLAEAGGTSDNARRSKIYILYANGNIGKTHNGFLGIFRSYPKVEQGAEIIVPRKTEKKGLSTTERIALTSAVVSLVSLVIITISNLK